MQTVIQSHGFLAGSASILSQIIFHPFELIKTRIQSHDGQTRNLVPKYKNLRHALKEILTAEGYQGLFKGLTVSLMAQAFGKASFFACYEPMKRYHTRNQHPFAVILSSLEAGVFSSFISQPLYIMKVRLLLNVKSQEHSLSAIKKQIIYLYQDHGIQGFYRGYSIVLFLSLQQVINLTLYEKFQETFQKKFTNIQEDQDYNSSHIQERSIYFQQKDSAFFSGILAKFVSLTIMYPFTTIKVRFQENQYIALKEKKYKFEVFEEEKYKNIRDLVQKIVKKEGVQGFYKGYLINIYRQVPQSGLFFLIYEFLKNQRQMHL